jgi:hypothetical protein
MGTPVANTLLVGATLTAERRNDITSYRREVEERAEAGGPTSLVPKSKFRGLSSATTCFGLSNGLWRYRATSARPTAPIITCKPLCYDWSALPSTLQILNGEATTSCKGARTLHLYSCDAPASLTPTLKSEQDETSALAIEGLLGAGFGEVSQSDSASLRHTHWSE